MASKSSSSTTGRLTKTLSPELSIVTLRRPKHEEHFITARCLPDESSSSLFDRVAQVVRQNKASVVSQDAFGLPGQNGQAERALRAAFGHVDWPVTWVDDQEPIGPAGTLVWAVSGPTPRTVALDGRVVGRIFEDDDARYCRLGGLMPRVPTQPRPQQARDVFDQMQGGLKTVDMGFDNVIRTWFFNHDILDWYGDFNKVRDTFFREHQVYDRLVPASTGIGGGNPTASAVVSGAFALRLKNGEARTSAVPSPLQCPALKYGSSFSRAVEIDLPDHRRLMISGTASIDPQGNTKYLDDMDGQVALTMEVVQAILESRSMTWNDVSRAIVYFKHSKDVPAFERYCQAQSLPMLPAILVNEDICRDDLLFEIELDAIVTL